MAISDGPDIGTSASYEVSPGLAGETTNGLSVLIHAARYNGADNPLSFLAMYYNVAPDGQGICYSNRFSISGLTGVTPPNYLSAVDGSTEGPTNVDAVTNNATEVGAISSSTIASASAIALGSGYPTAIPDTSVSTSDLASSSAIASTSAIALGSVYPTAIPETSVTTSDFASSSAIASTSLTTSDSAYPTAIPDTSVTTSSLASFSVIASTSLTDLNSESGPTVTVVRSTLVTATAPPGGKTVTPQPGLSTGAQVGIGIGAAVLCLSTLAIIILCLLRRHRRKAWARNHAIRDQPSGKAELPGNVRKQRDTAVHAELGPKGDAVEVSGTGAPQEMDDRNVRAELEGHWPGHEAP